MPEDTVNDGLRAERTEKAPLSEKFCEAAKEEKPIRQPR